MNDLRHILNKIDGKGYKAYKELQGKNFIFPDYILHFDGVQGDPFASPSKVRVRVKQEKAKFPGEFFNTYPRKVACEDYVNRIFAKNIKRFSTSERGMGTSGLIAIDCGKQIVLDRTAMIMNKEFIEARFVIGLPAKGRTIMGREAEKIFFEQLPAIVKHSMLIDQLQIERLEQHILLYEDQEWLRNQLASRGLISFVANGSTLPRSTGISDLPLNNKRLVPFQSPPSLEVEFTLPNSGAIKGMGIPKGIIIIVGGGYHGKTTLLKALARGVYNHIEGDGREFVLTQHSAVQIRAEDGRRVEKVNISPFINNLPFKQSTQGFSTDNASGSTSQAANVMEALEAGADVLLLDEDTSATNFMIRDKRMQCLVNKEKEPITPFVDKVQQLKEEKGVSTILIVGGSGDYFDVADIVIGMDNYHVVDLTSQAKIIAKTVQTGRNKEGGDCFGRVIKRAPIATSMKPYRGRKVKISARGVEALQYGEETIDLSYLEQLIERSQVQGIGEIIYYTSNQYFNGSKSLLEALELTYKDISEKGLDILSPYQGQHPGEYSLSRRFEVMAAVNRLRTLDVRQI